MFEGFTRKLLRQGKNYQASIYYMRYLLVLAKYFKNDYNQNLSYPITWHFLYINLIFFVELYDFIQFTVGVGS